ncbi:tyrosine-type recombinase/integrase [uncultured Actinomyces sp.]|uniref:tyrosine-type recombinase/integrase n=1 Tax=uncultured Actinomyces sp. TaxID=249061 RepID=UPI0028064CAF|nr:tyrosine-type recombinase/integrase [uncultured Actinomyces sp.]
MTARSHRRAFGTISRLPSGRFRARYTGADGAKHSAPTTFDTRARAEAWLVTARAEVIRGRMPVPETASLTLATYLPAFLTHRSAELRPSTLGLYDRLAGCFILTPVGTGANMVDLSTVPLAQITTPLVRDWHTALLTQFAQITPQSTTRRVHPARAWAKANGIDVPATGRLPRAVLDAWQAAGRPDPARRTPNVHTGHGRTQAAQAYRLLRTVLSRAVEDGLIDRNPACLRGAATAPASERKPLTPAQVSALAAAMPPHLRAAALLAAYSGLRPGEVFALRRRDIDLSDPTNPTVTVERTQTRTRAGQSAFGPPKTAAGRRTVAIPATVARALADHLAAYTAQGANALVFTTPAGGVVSASYRSRAMVTARAIIGRTDLRWHDLRHTGATLAAASGATMAELQAHIGHTSTQAAAIYQHALAGRDAQIAAALDAFAAAPSNVIPLRARTA